MQCIECYICWHCWHWCLWLLHNTVYRVMRCGNCIDSVDIDSIECMRDPCLVLTVSIYKVLMVWLKSPQSQHSKTFCGLKIGWILRKLWAGMCGCVCINSVDIDSIECIRDPCLLLTVSTYIVLMVWLKSPQSQLSVSFCRLKISWI